MKNCVRVEILQTLIILLALSACGKNNQAARSGSTETARAATLPTITIDDVKLFVEIVQNPDERALGLMNRDHLPENRGMLFVFQVSQPLSFWMRNTFIPLDIAFIDEAGKIVDIQTMEPLDESKNYVSSAPAQYALEVNKGWFSRNNLKVGSIVSF